MDVRLKKGFTLSEVLMVTLIMVAVTGISFSIFLNGQNAWFTSDAKIELQENLRTATQRITAELRQTQVAQQNIFQGAGPGGSDVIRFSIPVICQSGGNFLDAGGNIAHWGAPLTWGCSVSSCMDADDSCATVEYKFLEYRLNGSAQLVRDVLDGGLNLMRSDVIANALTDFQASLSGKVITLTFEAQKKTVNNRLLAVSSSQDVLLRN